MNQILDFIEKLRNNNPCQPYFHFRLFHKQLFIPTCHLEFLPLKCKWSCHSKTTTEHFHLVHVEMMCCQWHTISHMTTSKGLIELIYRAIFFMICGRNFEDIDLRFFANCRRQIIVFFLYQYVVIYSLFFLKTEIWKGTNFAKNALQCKYWLCFLWTIRQ